MYFEPIGLTGVPTKFGVHSGERSSEGGWTPNHDLGSVIERGRDESEHVKCYKRRNEILQMQWPVDGSFPSVKSWWVKRKLLHENSISFATKLLSYKGLLVRNLPTIRTSCWPTAYPHRKMNIATSMDLVRKQFNTLPFLSPWVLVAHNLSLIWEPFEFYSVLRALELFVCQDRAGRPTWWITLCLQTDVNLSDLDQEPNMLLSSNVSGVFISA